MEKQDTNARRLNTNANAKEQNQSFFTEVETRKRWVQDCGTWQERLGKDLYQLPGASFISISNCIWL